MIAASLLALASCTLARPTDSRGVSASEEAAVRSYLERYPQFLLDNPELLDRALQLAREEEARKARLKRQQTARSTAALLEVLAESLAVGDPRPLIEVIAFTDYEI